MKLDNYVAEPVVEDPNGANGVTMGQDGSMQVFNSSTNIQTMVPGADGTIWLFRQTNSYADDGTEGTSISELIQLDAHGTLLRTITPAEEEDADETDSWRYTYIDTILSDDKGYVYTYDYQTVNVYGPDGSFVFSKSGDEPVLPAVGKRGRHYGVLRRRQDGLPSARPRDEGLGQGDAHLLPRVEYLPGQ